MRWLALLALQPWCISHGREAGESAKLGAGFFPHRYSTGNYPVQN